MCRQLDEYPELHNMLCDMLYKGKDFPYNPDNHVINIGTMFGFLKQAAGNVAVANRIFEMGLP